MFSRLPRYLVRETFGLYILGVLAFSLLLSIDFLTVWARFLIEQNASPSVVGRLMLLKVPWFLHLALPISVVFAVLLATGRLAKDSELKAAYSLGVPPLRLLGPMLAFGIVVSLVSVVNNGWLEPRAEVASREAIASFLQQRPPTEMQADVSYRIPDEGIYYVGRIRTDLEDRRVANLTGVTIIREDGSILSAPNGTWDSRELTWTLHDAQILEPGSVPRLAGTVTVSFRGHEDASVALARTETLTLSELWSRVEAVRAGGGDAAAVTFEFHRRLADAFSAAIFVLIAGTLGLHLRGRSAGFGWTIALLVVFYFLWTLSGNLFDQRVLSPVAAAWFTSAVVGALGMALALVRLR